MSSRNNSRAAAGNASHNSRGSRRPRSTKKKHGGIGNNSSKGTKENSPRPCKHSSDKTHDQHACIYWHPGQLCRNDPDCEYYSLGTCPYYHTIGNYNKDITTILGELRYLKRYIDPMNIEINKVVNETRSYGYPQEYFDSDSGDLSLAEWFEANKNEHSKKTKPSYNMLNDSEYKILNTDNDNERRLLYEIMKIMLALMKANRDRAIAHNQCAILYSIHKDNAIANLSTSIEKPISYYNSFITLLEEE